MDIDKQQYKQQQRESSCQIKRYGIVMAVEEDYCLIEVKGKKLRIPTAKAAPALQPFNRVEWNGDQWIITEQDKR